MMKTL